MDHTGGIEETVPRQDICFGEIRAHFHIDEADGTFYQPRLYFRDSFLSSNNTFVAGVTYSVDGGLATGPPETHGEATSPATAWAVLPEGIQYQLKPEVSFKAADGNLSSFDELPDITIPSSGTLGCSEVLGICLLFEGGSGDGTAVTVGLDPDLGTCLADGSGSEYEVVVEPHGTPLEYVTVTIGSETQTLCSSCVAGPGLSFDLSEPSWNLSPGHHDLQVLVGAGGCEASMEKSLVIYEQELEIACGSDLEEFLSPGQTEVPESQIHDLLGADVSGGCGVTGETEDDRPQIFPAGTTTIQFTHGGLSCQQNVNVLESTRQIAYADGDQVVVRRLEDGATQYQVSLPSPQRIVYDSAGERMAVLHEGGVTIVDAADGGNAEFLAGNHVSLAFRPGYNQNFAYSEVIEEGASYSIGVNAGFPIDVGTPIPAIDGVRISPAKLAWSTDGSNFASAWAFNKTTPDIAGDPDDLQLHLNIWSINDLVTPAGSFGWESSGPSIVLDTDFLGADINRLITNHGMWIHGPDLVPQLTPLDFELADFNGFYGAVVSRDPSIQAMRLQVLTNAGVTDCPWNGTKAAAVAGSRPLRKLAVTDPQTGRVRLYSVLVENNIVSCTEDGMSFPSAGGPGLAFRPIP